MVKGDKCWIIENGSRVTQADILSFSGNLCLIRLQSGTTIRVPKHRLYSSEEEAAKLLPKKQMKKYSNPYDYM